MAANLSQYTFPETVGKSKRKIIKMAGKSIAKISQFDSFSNQPISGLLHQTRTSPVLRRSAIRAELLRLRIRRFIRHGYRLILGALRHHHSISRSNQSDRRPTENLQCRWLGRLPRLSDFASAEHVRRRLHDDPIGQDPGLHCRRIPRWCVLCVRTRRLYVGSAILHAN